MTCATAEFPAEFIARVASARIAWLRAKRVEARQAEIIKIRKVPIGRAFLFFGAPIFPSEERATEIYTYGHDGFALVAAIHYVEGWFNNHIRRLTGLNQLAEAAAHADPFADVTLTVADCTSLGFPQMESPE